MPTTPSSFSRPLLLVVLFAQWASAQSAEAPRGTGSTVSGVVYDSVARAPIASAMVQLAGADGARFSGAAVADSLGRYAIADVPKGKYMLGFFHPMQDSLGLEPTLREVSVDGRQPVSANLAIPSPATLRVAVCGAGGAAEGNGVVMGAVFDARDNAPAAGVTVTGQWLEMSFTKEGVVPRRPSLVAVTKEKGWFALCNVPSGGMMTLVARRGADSTDRLDVQVPASGFLRRELFIGTVRERMSGVVVATVGGQPLSGAQVSIGGGPQILANERGEWTFTDAPSGTRMLEVRAVGYYPERRHVNVVAGAPPLKVALNTLKAVLDTIKVTANRADLIGFDERRRSGVGKYLTAADIARRLPTVTSDLFTSIAGVTIGGSRGGTQRKIGMRGVFDTQCSPAIYLDSHYLGGVNIPGLPPSPFTADDLDMFVTPDRVAGVEVYVQGTVPPQFQQAMSDCGSIVIWTKR
ncbi:MAG: hypothetical protein JWM95_4102 [Gemmatimonadetes bacterium]|nr:hypothetical protein [Gemmatimonadota bacterium]